MRTGWLTGCLILAILGAAACGSRTSHASSTPASASAPGPLAPPARCAQTQRPGHVALNSWPQARERLAPTGPDAMRLCRYSGLNGSRPDRLLRSRLLTDHSLLTNLVGEFNELPPFPRGVFGCPADDGSQILALLAYRNGKQVTIAFGLMGCRGVMNGDLVRTANGSGSHPSLGPNLLGELERLTR